MSILDVDPIFSIVCQEKEGDIIRSVRPMPYTIENFQKFWEKARQFKTIFSKEVGDNFNTFLDYFIQNNNGVLTSDCLIWVIDDFVGVLYVTDFYFPQRDALAHYTFFDRRHHGRYQLMLKMLKYLFDTYNLERLSVEVPLYATQYSFKFVESLGFRPEGRRRHSAPFNGQWFDVKLFGMLKDEIGIPYERNKELTKAG